MSDERLLTDVEYDAVDSCGMNIRPYLEAQDTKTAKHFNEVVIPAKMAVIEARVDCVMKAARKELIAEIEAQFEEVHQKSCDREDGCHLKCCNPTDASQFCLYFRWQQLKQKEG
jgi:hypothetical protein